MKFLLIAFLAGVALTQAFFPDATRTAIQNAGVSTLSAEITALNDEMTAAIDVFKPINATCTTAFNNAVTLCKACVEEKCSARAQSVCRPEEWQIVLGQALNIVTNDIPDFFTETIPDVFVNEIGGGIVDVTKDAGNFFEHTVGGGIIDAGTAIGDGVVDFGKGIGSAFEDAGSAIENVAVDGFNTVVGGVNTAIDEIGDFGEQIGDTIGGGVNTAVNEIESFGNKIGNLLGIGKRSIRMRRSAEPGCSQFKSDSTVACQFYLSGDYCPDCQFDTLTECPGYDAALQTIQEINSRRTWMSAITNNQFTISSINPGTFDPATGGFTGVGVSVHIFGKDFTFTVDQSFNPYVVPDAAPIITQHALDLFKASV